MQHRRDANLRTEMFWISRDPDHGISTHPHQQIIDHAFVLIRDVSDGFWQSENEVEIADGQQFGLACRQPGFGSGGLTFGAMAIAARVVGNVLMGAVFTPRDMTAKRGRTAALYGTHHLQLVQADASLISRAIHSTIVAEDIRNLQ